MPLSKPFKNVPTFSLYQIRLAHLCAWHLWDGLDFETGKPAECSDEELLFKFAVPFQQTRAIPTRNHITEQNIRQLIRVGRLKALFRSANPTDFQKGIKTIKKSTIPIYNDWRFSKRRLTPTGYATKAILELGMGFVNQTHSSSINGNYRVPLASRVLFFAVPDMLVFNYSNGLGKAMNFQSRPQAAIPYFNKEMHEGLKRNHALLSKFKMPPPVYLDYEMWERIKKYRWWQRRVLDIALLLHFNVAHAHPDLIRLARSGFPKV